MKKLFRVGAVASSMLASTLRGWRGSMQRRRIPEGESDEVTLELYEFEACPFCRLVREAVTELQLDVKIYPCPPGGTRWRRYAFAIKGGETTFPFLVDTARDVKMSESADIVAYLWREYADREPPARSPLTIVSSSLATLSRLQAGGRVRRGEGVEPELPLELYSFESSPYCRLVREVLCELEIPYILRSMAKEQVSDIGPSSHRLTLGEYEPVKGGRREKMIARFGKAQVPLLIDPNEDITMFESSEIIDYLERTYGPRS